MIALPFALAPFAVLSALALVSGAAHWLRRRHAPDSAVFPELNGEG